MMRKSIRLSLSTFLTRSGYEVETASSATQALEMLDTGRFSLMLSDIRMPGMTGVELVPKALAANPDLAIVMLTAVNNAPTATEALSRGAMGYLTKPVELPDLHESILKALHRREMLLQQREIDHVIREEVTMRTAELEREKSALRDLTIQVAESLVIAMEAKNPYMRGRSIRIGEMSAAIADEMELDVDTVEAVRLAARLMDVGKIGIREEILNKPGSLTPEEFAHVKQHVEMGDQHPRADEASRQRARLRSRSPRALRRHRLSAPALRQADLRSAAASSPPLMRTTRSPPAARTRSRSMPHSTLEYLSERIGTLIDPDRCSWRSASWFDAAARSPSSRQSRTDLERAARRRARLVQRAQLDLASNVARLSCVHSHPFARTTTSTGRSSAASRSVVHEAGHVIFSPFGEMLEVAGGSITQLAVPLIVALLFLRQREYFGISVALAWLSMSLTNLATYIGDARNQFLGLVSMGGGDPIHDWHFILGRYAMLGDDNALARFTNFLSALALARGGRAGRMAVQRDARVRRRRTAAGGRRARSRLARSPQRASRASACALSGLPSAVA